MGESSERGVLIDTALHVCIREGYPSVTLADLAHFTGMTVSEFGLLFPTKGAVVLAVLEDYLTATAARVIATPGGMGSLEVLCAANVAVIAAISAGTGVMPRARFEMIAHILTQAPDLRVQVKILREPILTKALIVYTGVDDDDPGVRHAITLWSAVVAASYNHDRSVKGSVDRPGGDGRVPEAMAGRLNDRFSRFTGRQPTSNSLPPSSA